MDSLKALLVAAFLAAALAGTAQSQISISIEPDNQTAYEPDNVLVTVAAENSGEMYGFQLSLAFNPGYLDYQGSWEGGLLSQGDPASVFCNPPQVSPGTITDFACTRIVPGNASSSGVLAVFNFSIAGYGTDAVELSGIKLSNNYSEPLSFSESGGEITTGQCQDGDTFSCGPGNETGECSLGERLCSGGLLGDCQGAVYPSEELCDGLDNDCDGSVDEGVCDGDDGDDGGGGGGGGGGGCLTGQERNCSGEGICPPATQTCTNGVWGPCTGSREPTDEVCNGIDDDCDGVIDDNANCCTTGQTRECGPTQETGECRKGVSTCSNGVWGTCAGAVFPVPEVCFDNLDNDCDGIADNNCTSDACLEGPIPPEGCICEGQFRSSGYCCSGLYFPDSCPFSWIVLIYAGVIILIVLYAIVFYLKRKGEDLTWDYVRSLH